MLEEHFMHFPLFNSRLHHSRQLSEEENEDKIIIMTTQAGIPTERDGESLFGHVLEQLHTDQRYISPRLCCLGE